MITIHENLNSARVCNECHIQWPMLTVGIPCSNLAFVWKPFLDVVCCSCCSIGSLGANNSWAHVSDVLVEKATLLGTTNGVRIKTWQVMHGILAKCHGNLDSSSLFLEFWGKRTLSKGAVQLYNLLFLCFHNPLLCSFVSCKPGGP